MKKLLYLLIFALPATLFLGCREEEGASTYYPSKTPAFRLGDKIELPNEEEIPEVNYLDKALLTACSALDDTKNCELISTILIFKWRPPGPLPLPCDAGICEPLVTFLPKSYRFNPDFNHTILVIDRKSREIITELTNASMDEDALHFGGDVKHLLVPSGVTLLSINTSIMIDGEPVPVNYLVSINPESLEGHY